MRSLPRPCLSTALATVLATAAVGTVFPPAARAAVQPTPAVAPTAESAIIWARAEGPETVRLWLASDQGPPIFRTLPAAADADWTVRFVVEGLAADTTYRYRLWSNETGPVRNLKRAVSGSFRTAPAADSTARVRLAWGGDVAGQNVCRDATEGFPIFAAIRALEPDFFIGLGDMIYADNVCEPIGRYQNEQLAGDFPPATSLADYWAHWRYAWGEPQLAALRRQTGYFGIWDDHEVVNDFGPLNDTRQEAPYTGQNLLPIGLQAFLDYNPVDPAAITPQRLYRSLRWGRHLEIFILDNRQYRDANFEPDDDASPKTMLGREQVAWLKAGLAASDATWKLIVTSVPMSIPTGSAGAGGRDGWANFEQAGGYERELLDILGFMAAQGIHNNLWITTDVHFASVFRYRPIAEAPDFLAHEAVVGPLNAGLFPNAAFDTTLNPERLFFFGPQEPVTSWSTAKDWFNFGVIDIDDRGLLTFSVRDTAGETRFAETLIPRE